MKKIGKYIYLYCKNMGWNIRRAIYTDGSKEYIKINGSYTDLDWVINKTDNYIIDIV